MKGPALPLMVPEDYASCPPKIVLPNLFLLIHGKALKKTMLAKAILEEK